MEINYYIFFSIAGMFNLILIMIVFFAKERIKIKENNIYIMLMILTLFGIINEIVMVYGVPLLELHPFVKEFVAKLFLVITELWVFLLSLYTVIVSRKIDGEEDKEFSLSYYILIGIFVVCCFITGVLPIEYAYNESRTSWLYTYGPSVKVVFVEAIIYIFISLISIFRTKTKFKEKKFLPIYVYIILNGFVAILQQIEPSILMISYAETLVLLLMYFTIENPDVRMLEQVEIAKQQADKANQAKTDFLSNMSHEIRTPLNAIVGFSQALSEEDCLNEQAQDEVKDIMMASDNLLEIVNGILDISKIESGKLEIIAKDYSFKKLWDEIVTLGRGRMGDKPLEFRTLYDESIPEVLYGDSTRIKEVVVNLLTNAIKYTKEGYVELKVSSVIKDDVCRLIISVEDSGIGIKQENIEKLFSKFERFGVEKEITIEGTGLGLAITKKLVDLMNGTIIVQSVYGKGSKFTVSIDQKIQIGHHIEDTTQSLNLEELITADLSGKRVLVVDDNMVNLKVAARLLKDYNLMIDEVESGEECINKVMSDVKYDLILMDDMMPKMSGTETFHHLQELDGFNVPTIALTANAISGMKEKYLEEGFNDYLAKPIDRKELNKIIKKYLTE